MKNITRIIQWLVGILFILSGLVKANDPVSLGYKMQEFFELWSAGLRDGNFFAKKFLVSLFDFGHEHYLFLAITMITLEIAAGVALLVAWRRTFITWLLFLLIVFFTFLTGYAYLSGKFTNCGCFGDCLPITPFTSFMKDIVLTVLIIFLLVGKRFIVSGMKEKWNLVILSLSIIASLAIQWYALNYLPFKDCLPFKIGNNLPEQMKAPKGSTPSVYETRLVYANLKTGETKEMSQDEMNTSRIWENKEWKWKETKTQLVKKGNDDPPIKGFSLQGQTTEDSTGTSTTSDSTDIILSQPFTVLVFGLYEDADEAWMRELGTLVATCDAKHILISFATNQRDKMKEALLTHGTRMQVFNCDFTVIRTAARTNPEIYFLEAGTVKNKFSEKMIGAAITEINKR